jgi:eukaryotic-like serine/threonine-protein kinase
LPGLDKTGAAFGPYTLLKRLAMGGMGEIWLAERKGISGFSKRVVIKTILEAFSDDPDLVEMFLQEGRIAAGFTHPNIAQTYDLGQVEYTYYIAMEHVHGHDLRDLLISNIELGLHIPLNLVLRIIAETCEGLHYAHSWKDDEGTPAGIVHRDISPHNILVTFDGGIKIVDFGIAKASHHASRTRSGVLKGKYSYMSPEQVRAKNVDGRADIFALGVVMYETVTGRRLFKRESEMSTLDAVLKADVPSPTRIDQSVPRSIEAILMKALKPDPSKRFQTAREMQLVIEETMLAEGLTASSAHLSAYMHELFDENLRDEQTNSSKLDRLMDSLPSAKDQAPQIERTNAYISGPLEASVSASAPRKRSEPTRNLLMPQRTQTKPRKSIFSWAMICFFALMLAGSSWYLVRVWLSNNGDDGPIDAGSPAGINQPDAGQAVVSDSIPPETPDAGTISNHNQTGADSGGQPAIADTGPEIKKPADKKSIASYKPKKGFLSLTTKPPSAIFWGKKKLGKGTLSKVKLPAGKIKLKVVGPRGVFKMVDLVIRRGKHITRNVSFGQGTLRIVIRPWADVWIDGKKMGQTPMGAIKLLEGSHQVSLINSELGKKIDRRVTIKPGRETKIQLDWR